MIATKMQTAINKQINAEFYSGYLYLAMAAYFRNQGLDGFGHWMELQAQEEISHGMKMYRYIHERGGRVVLAGIDTPQEQWESPLAVFKAAYAHEQKVTAMIYDLVELAQELKDHATFHFLQWFVHEQVEEEASADEVVTKLEMVGASKHGLFMLDRQLGSRGSE